MSGYFVLPVGDPAGVGPDIAVRAALGANAPIALVGDARRLALAIEVAGGRASLDLAPGAIGVIDAGALADDVVAAHAPTPEGGAHQLRALDVAIDRVLAGEARAIVTGPVSKAAIVASGQPFVGQTEHLARRCGLADDQVTMMFLGDRLRVALVTTHLALRDVPGAITRERVVRACVHLADALSRRYAKPRIAVTSLNPHAGEGGLFGDEESVTLAPAIREAQASLASARLEGPVPAESAFRAAAAGTYDGLVAMYHDQATIASKVLDWQSAVNVTWGLPFVRTSVDHGVAYDAAARGESSDEGMRAAIRAAISLSGRPR